MLDTFVVLFGYLIVSVWFHKGVVTCLEGFLWCEVKFHMTSRGVHLSSSPSALCPCQSLLDVFYGAEQPRDAQYLGFLLLQRLVWIETVCSASCSWAREVRDCRGWGTMAHWSLAWWKAPQLGPLAAANPTTVQARATGQSCISQCHSQALPGVPGERCCHLAGACSSWGKAIAQMKIQLQELSFNPYSLCLE